jgi:hypothetical protein
MKDEHIQTSPTLGPAQAAVSYVLERIRRDADLRHHMIGTEAFARLCNAEAMRTGKTAEEVEARYATPAYPDEKPRLVACRQALRRVAELADAGSSDPDADRVLAEIRELADGRS